MKFTWLVSYTLTARSSVSWVHKTLYVCTHGDYESAMREWVSDLTSRGLHNGYVQSVTFTPF